MAHSPRTRWVAWDGRGQPDIRHDFRRPGAAERAPGRGSPARRGGCDAFAGPRSGSGPGCLARCRELAPARHGGLNRHARERRWRRSRSSGARRRAADRLRLARAPAAARFLRKARELAYRDLGGLVFSLHRFGQRNDSLVLAKLATLSRIDAELRALEDSLGERQPVTVLREAGITACPRCAAIHSGEDRFCPGCGLSMSRRSDLPIAGAPAGAQTPPPAGSPLAGQPLPAQPAPATLQPPPGASGGPVTQQHAALPATGAHAQPSPAPQPATQAFDAVPADGGDQPTEIIRPPAPGS